MINNVQASHPDVNRLQETWRPHINRVLGNALISGVAVGPVVIGGAGVVAISHTLGKTPTGWILTDLTAATFIFRTAWSASSISLSFSNACTISLWVF